jgi:vancomycin resistance protein YoaR
VPNDDDTAPFDLYSDPHLDLRSDQDSDRHLDRSGEPRQPRAVRDRARSPWTRAAWATIAIAVAFDVALFGAVAERLVYNGRVLPGVHVAGASVAGAHTDTARSRLTKVADTMRQRVIEATAGPTELHATAADLGLRVDVDATLAAARHDGHSGNPIDAAAGFVLRRIRNDDIGVQVHLDAHDVDATLARWDRESITGVRNAGITIHGTSVSVVAGHSGHGIDLARARTMLVAAASAPGDPTISLPLVSRQSAVSAADAQTVAERARKILSGTYTVHSGGHTFSVTAADVGHALGARVQADRLVLTIDGAHLRAAVAAPIRAIGTPPVDATFTVETNGHVAVVPSHDGTGPDFATIGRAILAGQREFDVPFGPTQPAHDTAWAQRLGITGLVSSFTTHHPCCQTRIQNIHRAASIIDGTIIEPGQVFSLNDAIGPRTQARGFVQAPVIADGEFSTDFGGGVSQLSTTTFNAAWWGGFEIVSHQPHSIYISRYPMGREATLDYPQIDMKWRNNTDHGVWLRTSYTGTSVTVSLYGNNDGRVVRETYGTCSVGPEYDTLTESRCLHIITTTPIGTKMVTCPATNPSDDPDDKCATLPTGQTASGAGGETGYSVEFYRTITQPGKPATVEHYRWTYTMNPSITLVGSVAPTTTAPGVTTTTAPGAPPPATTTTTP